MPTGYTADLNEGKQVTFQDFTLKCARAFGALIEMRDEPFGAPIPDEFRPSNYHLDAIEVAKKRLAEVQKWSDGRAESEAKRSFDKTIRSSQKDGEKDRETGRSYIAMLKKVGKWVPPTKDHENLKSFMIDQLAGSIEFDCLHTPIMPQRLSGKQYRAQLLKDARRDIAYHKKEYEKEIERSREKTNWVRALRQSLKASNNED